MQERVIDFYEENAAAWDRQRGRDLFERPWMERFASQLPNGGSILDLGCGMGEPLARFFIERGFKVTGVDSSPSLIAMCEERFPDHQWLVGDMRTADLRRRFDGVLAWHSFFHLSREDQLAMFPRFARYTRSAGILMFTSGHEEGETLGKWQGEPLYHASLGPDRYRALLKAHGFELVRHVAQDPECGHATIWMARQINPASGLEGSA